VLVGKAGAEVAKLFCFFFSKKKALAADFTIVAAWAVSRGVAPPVAAHGGDCVQVGLPDQARRYVFSALNEGAEALDEMFVFLKICAAPDAVRAVLPARWVIQAPSFTMMVDGAMAGGAGVPGGYRLVVEGGAPVASVRILAADGTEAARGSVVLADGLAVYDRIETVLGHRRRGLGRAVMTGLETVAFGWGLRRGVPGVTEAGRGLYEAMGWRAISPYTSAVIEG
jgi:GNAT superfamily N-acetyltransferase